ncbi:hypothetical protein VK90_19885 [Bacillus sp. LK2]|nr:hypothetical protein VK90_19885 [Bacillus sp. LK2]
MRKGQMIIGALACLIASMSWGAMFCIINSPYLFNVEATDFASIRADNTMPIVFKKLFVFILFII